MAKLRTNRQNLLTVYKHVIPIFSRTKRLDFTYQLKLLFLSFFALFLIFSQTVNANTQEDSLSKTPPEDLSSTATGPHIELALISDFDQVTSGQSIRLAVQFMPEEEWHTYWRNPGDSGEAPTIDLNANVALEFGDIQWPIPHAIPVAHLMNYGYEDENVLMVPTTVPDDLGSTKEIKITADVSWLVCKEDCIPGWATLHLSLPLAQQAKQSEQYLLFENNRENLPQAQTLEGLYEVTDAQIVVEAEGLIQGEWQLFPFRSDVLDHAGQQIQTTSGGKTRIVAPKSLYYNQQQKNLNWLVSNGTTAYYLDTTFNQASQIANPNTVNQSTVNQSSLLIYVLMAFAGGLILNLMPCVLPILSIKALALQNIQAGLPHKLAYLFGVLFCFNAFAMLIVILQQMGQQIGWGFHMQSPVVVILLAFLFTFIALVLFDALAVASRFAGIGQNLVEGNTVGSHFATGALAVIVASPCTAPFMAAALGIAFVSEPVVTFLLFNALAIGFALPLTVLFWSRKAMQFLPKPGVWMETFKRFLAFPMLLTVAWLVWVFAGQVGTQMQFLLMLCLILFSMFAWGLGRSKSTTLKFICTVGLLISIGGPVYTSLNTPTSSNNNGKNNNQNASFISSAAYSKQILTSLRDNNMVVLVNMTADWCITCKVNEQVALSSEKVKEALEQENVQYVIGDWTNKNTEVFEYLSQYERAGVPLYVVYSGNKPGNVLPQILTPNMVIDAINKAKEDLQNES